MIKEIDHLMLIGCVR